MRDSSTKLSKEQQDKLLQGPELSDFFNLTEEAKEEVYKNYTGKLKKEGKDRQVYMISSFSFLLRNVQCSHVHYYLKSTLN